VVGAIRGGRTLGAAGLRASARGPGDRFGVAQQRAQKSADSGARRLQRGRANLNENAQSTLVRRLPRVATVADG
jgi:hypothetical protein